MKDPYKILGISRPASQEEIKKAYRELIKKWHPDTNTSPEAEAKTKEINDAYEQLTKTNSFQGNPDLWNMFFGRRQKASFEDLFDFNTTTKISSSELRITFTGKVSEEDIMEISRMLAARGCKVTGHSLFERH